MLRLLLYEFAYIIVWCVIINFWIQQIKNKCVGNFKQFDDYIKVFFHMLTSYINIIT